MLVNVCNYLILWCTSLSKLLYALRPANVLNLLNAHMVFSSYFHNSFHLLICLRYLSVSSRSTFLHLVKPLPAQTRTLLSNPFQAPSDPDHLQIPTDTYIYLFVYLITSQTCLPKPSTPLPPNPALPRMTSTPKPSRIFNPPSAKPSTTPFSSGTSIASSKSTKAA